MFLIAFLAVIFGASKLCVIGSGNFDIELFRQSFITPNFIKGCFIFEALVEILCGLYILFL